MLSAAKHEWELERQEPCFEPEDVLWAYYDTLPFAIKKKYTSAARRVLPIGMSTNIGWSSNMRTLRHVIETRTAPASEEEIRLVFSWVAELAIKEWPALFFDYEVEMVDGLPWYKTEFGKI